MSHPQRLAREDQVRVARSDPLLVELPQSAHLLRGFEICRVGAEMAAGDAPQRVARVHSVRGGRLGLSRRDPSPGARTRPGCRRASGAVAADAFGGPVAATAHAGSRTVLGGVASESVAGARARAVARTRVVSLVLRGACAVRG